MLWRLGAGLLARGAESSDRGAEKLTVCVPCGICSQDEVKRILSQLGEKLSAREVDAILAEADPRRSGQVPYDFFVGMVKAF